MKVEGNELKQNLDKIMNFLGKSKFDDNGICLSKEVHNLTKTYDHYESANNYIVSAINSASSNAQKCANLKSAINKIREELNKTNSDYITTNSRNSSKMNYNFGGMPF